MRFARPTLAVPQGCADDPAFVDELFASCAQWAAANVLECEAGNFPYTAAGIDAVKAACQLTCGTCPVADAVTSTVAVSTPGCGDSATFVDELGAGCAAWAEANVSACEAGDFNYSAAGIDAIQAECPLTCGTCPDADNSRWIGDVPEVRARACVSAHVSSPVSVPCGRAY